MSNHLDTGLIFFEGPISRAYANYFKKKNIKLNNIIYLSNKNFKFLPNKISIKLNYYRNNYHALQLLKIELFKKNKKLISNHFNLDDDFITDMYSNFDLKTIADKVFYISDDNINSEKLFDKLKEIKKQKFIFTGGGIVKKKIFGVGHDLIHIHPGYLPNIKGADGILWSTLKYNYIGVSSFIMNEKIDEGKIIGREKKNIFKLKLSDEKITNKDLYRFIFSFIDPLLRTWHLNRIIGKFPNIAPQNIDISEENNDYFSFMDSENFKKVKSILFE